jgi:hypothetical protein
LIRDLCILCSLERSHIRTRQICIVQVICIRSWTVLSTCNGVLTSLLSLNHRIRRLPSESRRRGCGSSKISVTMVVRYIARNGGSQDLLCIRRGVRIGRGGIDDVTGRERGLRILGCTIAISITIVGVHVGQGWLAGRHGWCIIQVALDHGRRTGGARRPCVIMSEGTGLICKDSRLPTSVGTVPNLFSESFIFVTATFPLE